MRSFSLGLILATALPLGALAQDADHDGAPDAADARPCDPTIAGLAYAPAEAQHGLILLEDHWPSRESDEDFNDVAVAYNYVYTLDAAGRVVRVQATLSPLAAGGGFPMGLGLHLPVARTAVESITLSTGGGAPVALTPSAADAELTVVLVPDLASVFGNGERPINSLPGSTRSAGQTLVVDVRLSTPAVLFASSAPHDVYIFHSETPSHEIHLPRYSGTAAMDRAMFGRWGDGSYEGHWFIDEDKIPMGLVLPLSAVYPREGSSITALFPRIAAWAESNGALDADFYLNDTVTAQAYRDVNGNGPFPPAILTVGTRDVSCVAVDQPINANATITDANLASYRGTRWRVAPGVTVTIGTSAPLEIHTLDLAGTIQPAACTQSACAAVDLRVAEEAIIRSTGVIQADARGYLGGLQGGNGVVGRSYGNATAGSSYTGGSHGGYGGRGTTNTAPTYGDFLHPTLPGGGGTSHPINDPGYGGGSGGGVIRLTAGGVLTLDGRIRANGGRAGIYDSGGAGGSIWLAGSQVTSSAPSGTVLVQANGAYGYYSGGGGGRVAVYGTPAGTFDPTTMVQAHGGVSGNYSPAGGGTIAHGIDVAGQRNVFLGNGGYNSSQGDTRLGTFGTISALSATVLTTNTWLQPGALVGRVLIADAEGSQPFTVAANTASTITIASGDLTAASAVGRSFCIPDTDLGSVTVASNMLVDAGCFTASGTVRVQNSASLDAFRIAAARFELRNSAQATTYDVTGTVTDLRDTTRLLARNLRGTTGTVDGSAILTGWGATMTRYYPLTVTFGTFTVGASARVSVDELGYLGNNRGTPGQTNTGRTNGNVLSGASAYTGGSHGGYGGIPTGSTPPMTYGDIYQPISPGGGGTTHQTSDSQGYNGGNGGGVLRLDVSGDLTLEGRLTANGGRGSIYDSGGAGGSIWVTAGTLTRAAGGLAVQASGAYGYYSGGAGGRIALHYGSLGGTWAIDSNSVQAYGGVGGNYSPGGSGTVLYRRTTEPRGRLLLAAPSGLVSAYARTRIGAFGRVTSVSGSVLTVPNNLEAGALVGRTLRPDAERAATFTIASNTGNSITVVEPGLAAATAGGSTFLVQDYHTDFDEVIVEAGMSVDAGRFAVAGALTTRGAALLDFSELAVGSLDVRDTSRTYGRAITSGPLTVRNSARLTVMDALATTLAVADTAVLTGWETTNTRAYALTLRADTMSVASGATVHTDALGYRGNVSSSGTTGRTNGNVLSFAAAYTGGSHGGLGGAPASYTAPSGYGDVLRPALPGGGGSSHPVNDVGYTGGNGGGVVRISVAGNLALDGRISANAGRGGIYDAGGAGGSVWIDAGSISRTTSGFAVEANGSYGYYSGGGGGRIALYYGALTGWNVTSSTVRAIGGVGGNYSPGGSGTIAYQPSSQARASLLMSAAGGQVSSSGRTRLGTFGTVNTVNGAVIGFNGLTVPAGALVGRTLVVDAENEAQTFTIVANTASSITADAPLTGLTASGASWYVRDDQTRFQDLTVQGDVEVAAGSLDVTGATILEGTADLSVSNADLADLTVRGTASRLDARRITGTTLRFGDASVTTVRALAAQGLTIDGTAVVTSVPATTTAVYPLTVSATDLTVGSTARLHVDALGYLGNGQRGNGATRGRTNGNVQATTADIYTGGSHGGRGGAPASGNAAAAYGSSTQPTTPGGGGSSHPVNDPGYFGGNGGGVLRIQVANRFTLDGVISSNGGRGGIYDAGGAGGSIWVTTGVMASGGAGRFEALGSYGYYSGGGGGRIAVQAASTAGWTGSASSMRAGGGVGGNYGAGAAGTTVSSGL